MHGNLGTVVPDGAEWEDPDWLTSILTPPPRLSEDLYLVGTESGICWQGRDGPMASTQASMPQSEIYKISLS